MLKDQNFYHSHIRRALIAFGALFNNIYIKRTTKEDAIAQSIKVPLSYGPKQKQIVRIDAAPDLEGGRTAFEVVLPRMGFEITSFTYDPARKLVPTQNVRSIDQLTDPHSVRRSFVSTPYNMGVTLSVFAKHQDDGYQVVEQIFPYFNPDFNVTVNEIPELGVKRDIQFVLDSVNYTNDYEGGFENRIKVMWDLNFTVKINFFGYVDHSSIIRKVITNIYDSMPGELPSPMGAKITTVPDPITADPSEDYTYIQTIDESFSQLP